MKEVSDWVQHLYTRYRMNNTDPSGFCTGGNCFISDLCAVRDIQKQQRGVAESIMREHMDRLVEEHS